jgi:hypothetical protein
MFALITKVNEGESNTPCPSTLVVTYSSAEKLSKALPHYYNASPNNVPNHLNTAYFEP